MYLDRLGQLIRACLSYYIALHGQKERLYMSANESKLYTFKEREWVVTGWAEGQMETEREDDKGQKVIVMQPYYQLFVISPVSSYKSDNYSANGMKLSLIHILDMVRHKGSHACERLPTTLRQGRSVAAPG